jgi:hypothetical protein
MKTLLILAAMAVTLALAAPARADHKLLMSDTPRTPETTGASDQVGESSVDIDLKLGLNGFRFGSRLFGRDGYTGGAWLNGQTRPDGFSVDGRLEREGKAHNFKLNVDIDEWLRRALRWRSQDRTDL